MTNFKIQRLNSGLTQGELAELLGITVTYISLMETGKKIPSARLGKQIADLFNTTYDHLFLKNKTTLS